MRKRTLIISVIILLLILASIVVFIQQSPNINILNLEKQADKSVQIDKKAALSKRITPLSPINYKKINDETVKFSWESLQTNSTFRLNYLECLGLEIYDDCSQIYRVDSKNSNFQITVKALRAKMVAGTGIIRWKVTPIINGKIMNELSSGLEYFLIEPNISITIEPTPAPTYKEEDINYYQNLLNEKN